MDMEGEIWAPLPWDDRYEVSSHGRVRSWLCRGMKVAGKRASAPTVMRLRPEPKGYQSVCLSNPADVSRRRKWFVHHLVLLTFHGPKPHGCRHGKHLDGDPANNRWDNVAWGSVASNQVDRVVHGRGTAKLDILQVLMIRAYLNAGASATAMAKAFGVHEVTVKEIARGRTWGWLLNPEISAGCTFGRRA